MAPEGPDDSDASAAPDGSMGSDGPDRPAGPAEPDQDKCGEGETRPPPIASRSAAPVPGPRSGPGPGPRPVPGPSPVPVPEPVPTSPPAPGRDPAPAPEPALTPGRVPEPLTLSVSPADGSLSLFPSVSDPDRSAPASGHGPVAPPEPSAGPSVLGVPDSTARTGTRRTVPHVQPVSGWGQSSSRPQAPQRTVTHSSVQFRCVMRSAITPVARGGATGLPHAQGKTGAAYACVRRHSGQRTGTDSPTTNPLSFRPIVHPSDASGGGVRPLP